MSGIIDWVTSNIWGMDDNGQGYVCDDVPTLHQQCYDGQCEGYEEDEQKCLPVENNSIETYKEAAQRLKYIIDSFYSPEEE